MTIAYILKDSSGLYLHSYNDATRLVHVTEFVSECKRFDSFDDAMSEANLIFHYGGQFFHLHEVRL
jgi:hypothetical protein